METSRYANLMDTTTEWETMEGTRTTPDSVVAITGSIAKMALATLFSADIPGSVSPIH